jgi:hypothetical protein
MRLSVGLYIALGTNGMISLKQDVNEERFTHRYACFSVGMSRLNTLNVQQSETS